MAVSAFRWVDRKVRPNYFGLVWPKFRPKFRFRSYTTQVATKNVVEPMPLKALGPSSKKLSPGRRKRLNRSFQNSSSSSIHTIIEDPGTDGIVPDVQVHLKYIYTSMNVCFNISFINDSFDFVYCSLTMRIEYLNFHQPLHILKSR